jgi:hypothetical protein
MKAASGTLLVHVSPAGAHIALHREGDTAPLTVTNNEKTSLRPGSYVLSAEASKFETKTATIAIEAGKNTLIEWPLQAGAADHKITAAKYFENGGKWTDQGGWWAFNGKGYSFFRSGQGAFTFDILRESSKGGLFSRSKKIVFVADYKSERNRILYVLDGRNLIRKVFTNGSAEKEVKVPHAIDGPICRITVEMSVDSITIKDKAGKVLDTVKCTGALGKLGFVDEIAIAPLAKS